MISLQDSSPDMSRGAWLSEAALCLRRKCLPQTWAWPWGYPPSTTVLQGSAKVFVVCTHMHTHTLRQTHSHIGHTHNSLPTFSSLYIHSQTLMCSHTLFFYTLISHSTLTALLLYPPSPSYTHLHSHFCCTVTLGARAPVPPLSCPPAHPSWLWDRVLIPAGSRHAARVCRVQPCLFVVALGNGDVPRTERQAIKSGL